MTDPIDEFLIKSLHDHRLSRAESKALLAELLHEPDGQEKIEHYAHRALQMAKSQLHDSRDAEVVEWFYDVLKVLRRVGSKAAVPSIAETAFSPGQGPRRLIQNRIRAAVTCIDCCVFTITDNELSQALVQAHGRGVALRILSDDDKSYDRGSDLQTLIQRGISVRTDITDAHMHHKFALFDRSTLLSGSYNWTRSAARENAENVLVTDDPRFVGAFQEYFDRLWDSLAPKSR